MANRENVLLCVYESRIQRHRMPYLASVILILHKGESKMYIIDLIIFFNILIKVGFKVCFVN